MLWLLLVIFLVIAARCDNEDALPGAVAVWGMCAIFAFGIRYGFTWIAVSSGIFLAILFMSGYREASDYLKQHWP